MSSGGTPGGKSSSTGYSPVEDVNAVLGHAPGQGDAMQAFLQALEDMRREIDIAQLTIEGADCEGCAYHLRRGWTHLKFASGVLRDMRERQKREGS